VAALFSTNYRCIDNELIQINVLNSCVDVFFAYPWNNFLHTTVEAIVQGILEGENEELKLSLLRDANLVGKICVAAKENDDIAATPKGMRRGYMGHITSISTAIINVAAITPSLEKFLAEHEEWQVYVKGSLQATRERESKPIGGYMPNSEDFAVDVEEGNSLGIGGVVVSHQDGMGISVGGSTGFEEFDDAENGEIVFESHGFDNREDYSANDRHDFRLEDDEDDDGPRVQQLPDGEQDEDEEELHATNIGLADNSSTLVTPTAAGEGEGASATTPPSSEMWEERNIEDVPLDGNTNHGSKDQQQSSISEKEDVVEPTKDFSPAVSAESGEQQQVEAGVAKMDLS